MKEEIEPLAVRLQTAATMLDLPISTMRDLVRRGHLPSVVTNPGHRRKKILIPMRAIHAFIEGGQR